MTAPPDPALAHELRTPLHGILAATALLDESALTAEQRGHVETIREAARALIDIADAVLDASAETAGPTSRCDPRRVVRGVRHLLEPSARAKHVALDARVDDDVPASLSAPAGPLRQVLVNLVGNAVKYTAAGVVAVRVRRDARPPGDRGPADGETVPVVIEVRDTGPGLDAAQCARLFEPYARPHAPAGVDGAGLGLAITAALVRRMGGEIGVRSAPGEGTTFTVRLAAPADEPYAPSLRPTPYASLAAIPSTPAPPPRVAVVLLVDDDALGRRVSASMLARFGYDVRTAGSLAEAARALEETRFDAVLLDRQLPDGDGCDLAAAIRRREVDEPRGRAARVVALTASADIATRRRCLAAGMDAVVVKPAGADELRAALDASAHDPPPPVLDAARLAELARLEVDAPGILARIAVDYARTSAAAIAHLRACLRDDDGAGAARAAHALRGASANAGAARAARLAAGVEAGALSAAALDALADAARAAGEALAARAAPATHGAPGEGSRGPCGARATAPA